MIVCKWDYPQLNNRDTEVIVHVSTKLVKIGMVILKKIKSKSCLLKLMTILLFYLVAGLTNPKHRNQRHRLIFSSPWPSFWALRTTLSSLALDLGALRLSTLRGAMVAL